MADEDQSSDISDFEGALRTFEAGNYTEALGQFLALEERCPKDAHVLFNIACCYARLGDLERSRQAIDDAIRLQPGLRHDALGDQDLEPVHGWLRERTSPTPNSRRFDLRSGWGIGLLAFGLLPVIVPVAYFRWCPLASPARYCQNGWAEDKLCEVCGSPAEKQQLIPYIAYKDNRGEYTGYDPRRWPANRIFFCCNDHLQYLGFREKGHLAIDALLYLLTKGTNFSLQALIFLHIACVCFGIFLLLPQAKKWYSWIMYDSDRSNS